MRMCMCEQRVLGEQMHTHTHTQICVYRTHISVYLSLSSSPSQWLSEGMTRATQYEQAEMGKTEISLMHFSVSKHT